ncbi:PQQ-dependent dehydrogenase, methanol/ethanol family [Aestuariivivens sediminis]|uniref:PQQ-dependent dehydrogenase, methanol/ethanol family n=1 Tax=Aestuariivivens sediminis TaxID=2913557 RepID=UPI001F57CC48|nr:PQQ-dependent dehydrogenase, methanol/ethanol family [Aestuariivivens sediminis]
MIINLRKNLVLFVSTLMLISCQGEMEHGNVEHIRKVTNQVDDNRLLSADKAPGDWLSYGRNYSEDRFSELDQITKNNIDSLGLAWALNLGTTKGFEATPLVVDGIMYVSGPWSIVYAINTRTGELVWTFNPEVPRHYSEIACCDVVNRGVALYKGKVFVGTLDGRLVAIDAVSGKKVWDVLTVDQNESYTITGAPRVYDGKVIIGNGGAEYGVRGFVTAYDALTGGQVWRFYTVPGDPALGFENDAMKTASKTWSGNYWETGGGGTAWDAFAYDPDLKLVYVGVGNGTLWNQEFRSPGGGDNLYLSSIVALNIENGTMKWYYQTTPGDTWDYTATQQIILANMRIKGQVRKILMQAPKNGFFYVIDRTNGELLSADPYVYVNWATHVDLETGRPVETPFGRYKKVNAQIFPGPAGGHNWQPMAYNPITNLVYIPARDLSMVYGQVKEWTQTKDIRSFNIALGGDKNSITRMDTLAPKERGKLIAWDPVNKKQVWEVGHKSIWNAGVLSTPDLVFQGTAEGFLVAYNATDGTEVWRYNVGSGVVAPPITYMVEGKQYVSIVSGWGGVGGRSIRYTDQFYPGTIYTFVIGGNQLPPTYPRLQKEYIDIEITSDEAEISDGKKLFNQYCQRCHGSPGNGGGAYPDLAYSEKAKFDIFNQIVGEGVYLPLGMPNFGDRLDAAQIGSIKNFILSTARELKTNEKTSEMNGNIH